MHFYSLIKSLNISLADIIKMKVCFIYSEVLLIKVAKATKVAKTYNEITIRLQLK